MLIRFIVDYPERHLRSLLDCRLEDLEAMAHRQLTAPGGDPGGVVGWSWSEAG